MKIKQAICAKNVKYLFYFLALFSLFALPTSSVAYSFNPNASYSVCFTPQESCTIYILEALKKTKKIILVQAYSFTSPPIAKALVESKKRGVEVKIILDKSQFKGEKYSAAIFLSHAGIPVWIDAKPSIAHNKIMILDDSTVITGSFNFTKAAEERNAENLLIIHDKNLAQQYIKNWTKRREASIPLADYYPHRKNK